MARFLAMALIQDMFTLSYLPAQLQAPQDSVSVDLGDGKISLVTGGGTGMLGVLDLQT